MPKDETDKELFRRVQFREAERVGDAFMREQERDDWVPLSKLSPIGRKARRLLMKKWDAEVRIAKLQAQVRIAQNECPLCDEYLCDGDIQYAGKAWDTCACVSSL